MTRGTFQPSRHAGLLSYFPPEDTMRPNAGQYGGNDHNVERGNNSIIGQIDKVALAINKPNTSESSPPGDRLY